MMKLSILTLAFALLAFIPQSFAESEPMMEKKANTLKTVLFYSDSCGSCKILDPNITKALSAVNPNKMELVKFDFSSKETIENTKMLAANKEVESVLNQYGAKTGFAILLDADGNEIAKFKVDHSASDIAGKMAMAIATQ